MILLNRLLGLTSLGRTRARRSQPTLSGGRTPCKRCQQRPWNPRNGLLVCDPCMDQIFADDGREVRGRRAW